MKEPKPDGLPLEIDVQQAARLLQADADVVLIDCRTADEYAVARINGSRLIPLDEIQQRAEELEPLRERRVIVHCHHGGRSRQVTEWLRSCGFEQVQNLTGGIDAWSELIDSSVPRY